MFRPPTIAADARRLLFGARTKRPTVDECRRRRRRRCCRSYHHHRMATGSGAVSSSSSSSSLPSDGIKRIDDDSDVGGGGWPHRRFLSSSTASASAAAAAAAADPPTPYSKPRNVELWEELASKELSKSSMTVDSLRSDRVTPVSQGERERERFSFRHNIIWHATFPLIHNIICRVFFSSLYLCIAITSIYTYYYTGGDRHPARILRSQRSRSENAS